MGRACFGRRGGRSIWTASRREAVSHDGSNRDAGAFTSAITHREVNQVVGATSALSERAAVALLLAQRLQWIDLGRPARGKVTRQHHQ